MFFKKDKGKDDKKAAISAEELLLAQKFLKKYEEYDETARFMSVVTNKAKKDSRLVLVLGNYFLFTIKEKGGTLGSGGKPKISRLVYYVDLLQVEIQSRSLVFIKFRERGKESDEKSKRISIAGFYFFWIQKEKEKEKEKIQKKKKSNQKEIKPKRK